LQIVSYGINLQHHTLHQSDCVHGTSKLSLANSMSNCYEKSSNVDFTNVRNIT